MIEDFRQRFFSDTQHHTLTVEITSDEWKALRDIIEQNGWEEADGLRFILATGKTYLQAAGETTERESMAHVSQQVWNDTNAQLAVMKYRAFHFMEAARLLEMKLHALEEELKTLRQANERLRAKQNE